jgi:hypothetical protein
MMPLPALEQYVRQFAHRKLQKCTFTFATGLKRRVRQELS